MKKISFLVAVSAIVAVLSSSCAKQCNCVRYEDGQKIAVLSDNTVKYFESSVCEEQSVAPRQGLSWVTDGKVVTVEIKCK
ncbi:MAG: hypothetical protein PHC83_05040 [Bacteroidales bacterium]|nr:hypothetical protein [Bacteroidales bacterium]MDD4208740.1 hypothetical protein [Bacteroidales bacterium]